MDHGIVWGHISVQGKALCELEATLENLAKLFCRKTHKWKTFWLPFWLKVPSETTTVHSVIRFPGKKNPITGPVGEAKHDRNLIIVSQKEMEVTTAGQSSKLGISTAFKQG